jgi:hypothetical protein
MMSAHKMLHGLKESDKILEAIDKFGDQIMTQKIRSGPQGKYNDTLRDLTGTIKSNPEKKKAILSLLDQYQFYDNVISNKITQLFMLRENTEEKLPQEHDKIVNELSDELRILREKMAKEFTRIVKTPEFKADNTPIAIPSKLMQAGQEYQQYQKEAAQFVVDKNKFTQSPYKQTLEEIMSSPYALDSAVTQYNSFKQCAIIDWKEQQILEDFSEVEREAAANTLLDAKESNKVVAAFKQKAETAITALVNPDAKDAVQQRESYYIDNVMTALDDYRSLVKEQQSTHQSHQDATPGKRSP